MSDSERPQRPCRSSSPPGLRVSSLGRLPTLWQLWTGRCGGRVVWWWTTCCWTFSPTSQDCLPDPGWSRVIPPRNSAASWSFTWNYTAEFDRPAGRSEIQRDCVSDWALNLEDHLIQTDFAWGAELIPTFFRVNQIPLHRVTGSLNTYNDEVSVSAAPAGGGPVADGGGVRQGVDAEEVGVSERWGQEAARSADAAGWPAAQGRLPQPGEDVITNIHVLINVLQLCCITFCESIYSRQLDKSLKWWPEESLILLRLQTTLKVEIKYKHGGKISGRMADVSTYLKLLPYNKQKHAAVSVVDWSCISAGGLNDFILVKLLIQSSELCGVGVS